MIKKSVHTESDPSMPLPGSAADAGALYNQFHYSLLINKKGPRDSNFPCRPLQSELIHDHLRLIIFNASPHAKSADFDVQAVIHVIAALTVNRYDP